MLRDRLICGINNKRIQCHLLSDKRLTKFEDVLQLALAMEAANKDARHLTDNEPSVATDAQTVHNIGTRKRSTKRG